MHAPAGADGNRVDAFEDFRVGDRLRLGPQILHVVPEKLPHAGHIRAAPSQIGGRLEGPDAGPGDEIVRVDDDPRVHGIRLDAAELQGVVKVLQHLRHHLAGARRVRLDVGQDGVLNPVAALAVMVQHDDRVGEPQQILAGDVARLIRIDHDERGVRAGQRSRLLPVDEEVLPVLRVIAEELHRRKHGIGHVVRHDVHGLPDRLRGPADADRGAERVDIHQLVSHHHDAVLAVDDLLERVGLDSRLHTGHLFGRFRLAAEETGPVSVLDHNLIAAPSECEFHRCGRRVHVLKVGIRPDADAGREGQGQLVPDVHGLHVVQNGETGFLALVKRLLRHHEEVAVIALPFHDSVDLGEVAVDLPLHQRQQKGPSDLLNAFHHFVVVVEAEDADDRLIGLPLIRQAGEIRLIEEADGNQTVIVIRGKLAPVIQHLIDLNPPEFSPEDASVFLHAGGSGRISLQDALLSQLGKQHGDMLVIVAVPARQRDELVVHPEEAAVLVQKRVGK